MTSSPPPPSTTLPAPGSRVDTGVGIGDLIDGKYRIVRVLGTGGMGVVVEARHETLDELVAIKFLLSDAAKDKEVAARFVREARSALRLKGAHVVRVLDIATSGGRPYLVMEHLEGVDLSTLLAQQGPLEVDVAIEYVLQACEAIAEAHHLGIVHRDLKPSNLFLTTDPGGGPLIKVLDFGIAKSASPHEEALTATGAVFGSPDYMPPEQIKDAKSADARSDVWALGVVLFELLTGERPFHGETTMAVLARIMSEPPRSLDSLRKELPSELTAAIMRCLRKSPSERPQSVMELATALAPFGSSASQTTVARIGRIAERTSLAPSSNGRDGRAKRRSSGKVSAASGKVADEATLRAQAIERTTSQSRPARARRGVLTVAAIAAVGAAAMVLGAVKLGGRGEVRDKRAAAVSATTAAPEPVAERPAATVTQTPVAVTEAPPATSASAFPSASARLPPSERTAAPTQRRRPARSDVAPVASPGSAVTTEPTQAEIDRAAGTRK